MPKYQVVHEERDQDKTLSVAVTDEGHVRMEMASPQLGRTIAVMSDREAERIGFAMLEAANMSKSLSFLPASEFELVYDDNGDVIGVRLV